MSEDKQLCDRCDASDPKPAVFHYLWDWGEKGMACAEHAQLLQQTATQLNRTISLHPLQLTQAAPLERDERTQLKAKALVIEEELNEAKARGLDLYRANTQLAGDVQLHKVRNAELEAQNKDLRAEVERLRNDVANRDSEAGRLVLENQRLETLAAFMPTERRDLGLSELDLPTTGQGHTVDG
jgi:hypothetical protein